MKHYSMRYEKFGNFVAELRRRKGCTQIELAKVLHVSNKTVSKWECGNSLPDITMLIPLSEALNISVTELLLGHYIEDDKVNKSDVEEMTINNLKDSKQKFSKKLYKIVIAFIVFIIITILAIYFFTTFNSVKLYRIKLDSDDFSIKTGMLMKTKIKSILQIGEVTYNGDEEITDDLNVKLYFKYGDDIKVIYEGYFEPIYLYEKYGYEEYLTDEFVEAIKDNLYITINYKLVDGEEKQKTYKLKVALQFQNNKLFNYEDDNGAMSEAEEFKDKVVSYEIGAEDLLINDGFFCIKELEAGTCLNEEYIKYVGDYSIKVNLLDKSIEVVIADLNINYDIDSGILRIIQSSNMVFGGFMDNLNRTVMDDAQIMKSINYLKEYINLLN